MKDILKIGLGIVIGFICLGALCCGGIVLFGSALPSAEKPLASPEVLALGNYITSDGLKLGVMEYRVTNFRMTSWGEVEKPREGAKFISFRIYVENIGETAITFPDLFDTKIIYKGEDIAAYVQCDAEWDDYRDCIWERLYPGTSCEGWRCYEIPQALEPSELTLRLNVSRETFGAKWHSWRLE